MRTKCPDQERASTTVEAAITSNKQEVLKMETKLCLVLVGSPVEGFSIFGPYTEAELSDGAVGEMARCQAGSEDWYTIDLEPPSKRIVRSAAAWRTRRRFVVLPNGISCQFYCRGPWTDFERAVQWDVKHNIGRGPGQILELENLFDQLGEDAAAA
jgi:hypothetical protein